MFSTLSKDKPTAARLALGLVKANPAAARQLVDAGRLLIFLKGTDSHDYKFSSAVLEDYYHVSPKWRPNFLAAGVFQLRTAAEADNGLVKRTRAALA